MGLYKAGQECDTVLVRIFGENTDKIIDRVAEVKNIKVSKFLFNYQLMPQTIY